ncbi:hypothetical protein SCAR479_11419 [Seiridium cardinale]|uniref:C2H2-type domain-containing protein n=1 Tax=Seiridium cardinale TaxID=138064 RepID=A0ABR2XDQ4_9PEZI
MDYLQDKSWQQKLIIDSGHRTRSGFFQRYISFCHQFDTDFEQWIDQFNTEQAKDAEELRSRLLDIGLPKNEVENAIEEFLAIRPRCASTSITLSNVSTLSRDTLIFQKDQYQYQESLVCGFTGTLDPSATSLLIPPTSGTLMSLQGEVEREYSPCIASDTIKGHRDHTKSEITVKSNTGSQAASSSKGPPLLTTGEQTLLNERVPSTDRPLTAIRYRGERVIDNNNLSHEEYPFCNKEFPGDIFILRCPTKDCGHPIYEHPFKHNRATRHFVRFHLDIFDGASPTARIIFDKYALRVIGLSPTKTKKYTRDPKRICDLSKSPSSPAPSSRSVIKITMRSGPRKKSTRQMQRPNAMRKPISRTSREDESPLTSGPESRILRTIEMGGGDADTDPLIQDGTRNAPAIDPRHLRQAEHDSNSEGSDHSSQRESSYENDLDDEYRVDNLDNTTHPDQRPVGAEASASRLSGLRSHSSVPQKRERTLSSDGGRRLISTLKYTSRQASAIRSLMGATLMNTNQAGSEINKLPVQAIHAPGGREQGSASTGASAGNKFIDPIPRRFAAT